MLCPSRQLRRIQIYFTAISSLMLMTLIGFGSNVRAQDITVHGTDGPRAEIQAMKQQLTEKARVATGELPPSRLHPSINAEDATTYRLPPLIEKILKQQASLAKPNQIGVSRQLSKSVLHVGEVTTFDVHEGRISLVKFVSEGALEVRLHFANVALPDGARLYVYSAINPNEIYGPFTGRGQVGDGDFWSPSVVGDAIVIEYVTPSQGMRDTMADTLPFSVEELGHIYREARAESFGGAKSHDEPGACNLTVPEEWKATARSVGRIRFRGVDGGIYSCTGTLLNARSNDLTPYFLTANHCISTPAEARSASIDWFYDNEIPSYLTSNGASLLSTNSATDYTLLMIDGAIPTNLRWAGWTTINSDLGTAVYGIHHPKGSYKRFSSGSLNSATCSGGLPGPCENFHKVRWNANGGTTESGSSGSGIWAGTPADPLLVGALFGGAAACENPSGYDFYGRFDLTYPQIASFLEGGSDDELESNDTRQTARTIATNNYSNLVVKSTDEDWYRVSVPAGGTILVDVSFIRTNGIIELELFRGSESSPSSFPALMGDTLSISNVNNSNSAVEYFFRVYLNDDTRNLYNMNITVRTTANCTYTVIASNQNYPAEGGGGNFQVTTDAGCSWTKSSDVNWISFVPGNLSGFETGSGRLSYSLSPNSTPNIRTGTVTVAGKPFTITQQGVSCSYSVSPTTRVFSQSGGTGRVDVSFRSEGCQSWMATSNANWIAINSSSNATDFSGSYQGAVAYSVTPNTSSAARTGTLTVAGQTVTVTQAGADPQWQPTSLTANQVQFKTWQQQGRYYAYAKLTFPNTSYRVADWGQVFRSQGNFTVNIRLERSTAASLPVEVTTAQIYDLGAAPISGLTFVLRFSETASVSFSLTGSGAPAPPNSLDDARTFARQQYLDFLSREPDTPGLEFWTREVTVCGVDILCIDRKRVNTSGAFFLSQEFQATGYYIYRLYKGALNRVPYYSEFTPDVARVAAGIVVDNRLSPDAINRNKEAFARDFAGRGEFLANYPESMTAVQFIDRLFQNTGSQPSANERQALIDELSSTTGTTVERRARVLYKIVDGIRATPPANGGVGVDQLFETTYGKQFYDREYNRAFVLMQYFGYLKRDPDQEGYDFWLTKLNRFGNFIDAEMVRSFILAAEYRARFGQP